MFVDRVVIEFVAGKGGNGVVAWRREKFIPKGGPSGGNGGKGGSVILEADTQIGSLDWFRHRRILKAQNGGDGGGNCRQGRNGTDLILKVPCGTLVKDSRTGEILYDFVNDKERFVLCKGGRGGRGNDSFKTPTHQAPNVCTEGTYGQTHHVELELKLIADVGLVGFPNAGKSTLISSLAGLRVKVAAYPFTTLQPNLGFIELDNYKRVYIADIPGIIEGASSNRGLGLEFLRHIERTKLLIFILDASGIDGRTPSSDFRVLREEIGAYNPELLERPYLVALNKIDTEESQANIEEFNRTYQLPPNTLFKISAAYGEGLQALVEEMTDRLAEKEPEF
ncbi:GTPase ObgE [Candidatus Protochlamydia naegleriophila]|uniref:GTPase Obg n=1 Tax=Candidatus Protochlamydia naegleriophila TaxID=389348 RepID=A0A0U5EPN8_9BACT|nr:GTPase ObgE [Candidatus Protochlamydia naegleriophila]CUI15857.1 GTPase ObgE [Candidatus Protochlamydia naegleriophila]